MTPEQWSRLREVFFAVCQASSDNREKVLASLCEGDAEMMAGVRDLLAADEVSIVEAGGVDTFLDQPALGRVLSEVALKEVGEQSLTLEQIGPYRVVQRLGEGGMGTVFEADQEHPRRKVAVKVLRPGASSPQMLRRFRQEADLLAALQHPGIARIYEAGVGDVICKGQVIGRQPFFAMELVRGTTITDHVRERKLTTREIMKLMSQVADAVQHAHQNGVIHRDLKPGNILVDAAGDPKVLDFGVARPLDALHTRASLQTQTGQIVGTLAYMSPEQVGGDSAQVDTRSDVYSLGVILYELLAGRPPHDVRGLTLTAAIRIIRDESPRDLERIKPELRGDVSRIVAKAMAKERERRYQSAGALAEDIRRYLSDQPVLARPTSAIYQLRKFARRNKALVGGALATLTSLFIGMAGIVWFALGESRARRDAETSSKKAMRLAHRVSIAAAADSIERFSLVQARSLLQEVPSNERRWEWHYLWNQLDNSDVALQSPGQKVRSLWFGPDNSSLVSESDESVARWDLRAKSLIPERSSAVSLDGTHSATLQANGKIQLTELRTGQSKQLKGNVIKKGIVSLDPDGSHIAIGGEYGQVLIFSVKDDAKPVSAKFEGIIRALIFAPRGSHIAIQTSTQTILFDYSTGRTVSVVPIEDSGVLDLYAWLHDGSRLLWYSLRAKELVVQSFRIAPGGTKDPLRGLKQMLTTLVVSADDRFALGCEYDGRIIMWNLQSGDVVRTVQCPTKGAYGLAIDPDSRLMAVGDVTGLVHVFDVSGGNEIGILRGLTAPVTSIALSRDGARIAAGAADGAIRLWRSDSARDSSILRGHTSYVYPVAFSPDGKTIASGSWDFTIRLWDSATSRELKVLRGHKDEIYWLTFSPDGQRILSYARTKADVHPLIVWNTETGDQMAQTSLALSQNARPTFIAGHDRVWLPDSENMDARVWNSVTNVISREPLNHLCEARSPCISAKLNLLALIAGDDSHLELVNLATGQVTQSLCKHATRAIVSSDQKWIAGVSRPPASSGKSDFVGVWSAETGQKVGELHHEGGEVYDVAFSPDGTRIATCGRDKLVHIWDAETFEAVVGLRGHSDYVWSIAWSPDGATLASGSGDSTVRLWRSNRSGNSP